MVKEGLSIRLQEARATSGLSPQDVAEKLNVTVQAVSNWEKGRSFPDIGNLVKLSDLYGVSLDWLLKGEKVVTAETVVEVAVKKKEEAVKTLTENVEEDKEAEAQKETKDRTFQEILTILLILVLSCHLPLVGIVAAITVAVWMKRTGRKYKWIYVVCVFSCIAAVYNTCIVCDHLFEWGISSFEKISSL